MKRAFFLFCLFLAALSVAKAHIQPKITEYVKTSRTVCIAKVTAIKDGLVSFSVTDTVKGKPPAFLYLIPVSEDFSIGSEWVLAQVANHGQAPNSVGWVLKGDCGWVDAPVKRVDGKAHLVGYYGLADPKLWADPIKGLDLDQLRALALKP